MLNDSTVKVFKAAKVGDRLWVRTLPGGMRLVEVIYRSARRGRGGFVRVTVKGVYQTDYCNTFTTTAIPYGVEATKAPKPRKPRADRGVPRRPRSRPAWAPPRNPYTPPPAAAAGPPPSNPYTAPAGPPPGWVPPAPRIIVQTVLTVDASAMLFFRHAGLRQFPCSATELAAGRQKMILALHPDRGGSQEEFVSAMRAYEALLKQCR